MPPSPAPPVVPRRGLPSARAEQLRTGLRLHEHLDLARLKRKLHIRNAPRSADPQDLAVKFFVSHDNYANLPTRYGEEPQKERQQQLREAPEALEEDDELEEEGTGRDVLGDMEIAARIMITGGDEREDARMTRADRLLIRNAIFLAAKAVKEAGRDHVLTQDVVAALQSIGHDESLPDHPSRWATAWRCSVHVWWAIFSTGRVPPGRRRISRFWRWGYWHGKATKISPPSPTSSMMSHINDLVERHQHDVRPTLVVTDEGHIITTNTLLTRSVVEITKVWRKLGAWFWIATAANQGERSEGE